MARILTILLALASASLTRAQTSVVVPPSHAGVEGTASTNVPFGRSTEVRCQLAYDAVLVPRAGVIDAIALRLDGGQTAAGKQVEFSVRAATMATSLLALQATFAMNPGADDREVHARRIVALPAHGAPSTPSPFHLAVPFDVPFPYDPARGGLLFDIAVYGQAPGAYPLDATFVCESPTLRYGPAGCGPTGRTLVADTATRQVMWGNPLTLQVRNALANQGAAIMLGSREQGSWAGINIPHDLAPYGASGCWLSIDPLLMTYGLVDATGTANFPFTLPTRPELIGSYVRFQGLALEPGYNALGVSTSQPGKVMVCGPERVGRVWAGTLAATQGAREIGTALPLQLSLR